MAVDADIESIFGPVPLSIDLNASRVALDNGIVIAMLTAATVAVILRFVARAVLRMGLMADDWAIIIALVILAGCIVCTILGGEAASGRHVWALTVTDLDRVFKILYAYAYIYAAGCTATRISILFFFRRIFSPMGTYLKIGMSFGSVITLAYPIVVGIFMATDCDPVPHFWNTFTKAESKCHSGVGKFLLAMGIINMLTDFMVLMIPFPRIVKLKTTSGKKIAVCGIMALGFFVCVASIVRIWFIDQYADALDITWGMGQVFIWSTIEPAVAIVCACLPHLAPLARLAHHSIVTGNEQKKTASYGHIWRLQGDSSQQKEERYDYVLDRSVRDEEDEIGLTSYVMAGVDKETTDEKHTNLPDRFISVQSTFEQSTSRRSSQ